MMDTLQQVLPYVVVGGIALGMLLASRSARRKARGEAGSGRRVGGRAGKKGADEVKPPLTTAPPEEHAAWASRCWVQPGDSVKVHGRVLRGLVYVGQGLRPVDGRRGFEPALIDPELPVDRKASTPLDPGASFASYDGCSPAERAHFLQWIAGGRRDPSAPAALVLLFLQGLERRALFDALHEESARRNLRDLRAEVQRLLEQRADDSDFVARVGALDVVLGVLVGEAVPVEDEPPPFPGSRDMPPALQVGLSRLAAAGRPLPVGWALAWWRHDPESRPRTPARRCPEEFERLFTLRYREKFGEGLELPASRTPLVLRYPTLGGSFRQPVEVAAEGLFEVASRKPPRNALRRLADACADELDAYSRARAKESGPPGPSSLALLPRELVDPATPVLAELLRRQQEKVDAHGLAVWSGEELFEVWGETERATLTRAQARDLAELWSRLGHAIEPDLRRGEGAPRRDGVVVIYRAPEGEAPQPSRHYVAAAQRTWLAAAVVGGDGEVSEAEEERLEQHLESLVQLDAAESLRLRAHLHCLLHDPPALTGLRRRLADLPAARKAQIAQFCIVLSTSDGHLGKAEMKRLRRIYRALDLGVDRLRADIAALVGEGPGTPAAAGTPSPAPDAAASAAPPAPAVEVEAGEDAPGDDAEDDADEGPGFQLDMALVRAKLAETAEVSELLADVFAEQSRDLAPEPEPPPDPAAGDGPQVAGLDAAHSRLLRALVGRDRLAVAEFAVLAEAEHLLPAGAQETLNEAAYECCDAPVLEGEDPLEVLADVLEEMLAGSP